jgi:hypothetical protein
MPDRARITSLEAIESFRAKLIVYRDKASRVLDEANDEVVRTRLWLDQDRAAYWQSQIRRLARELEQREQELFSARLSALSDSSHSQQAAVAKAKQAMRDAEAKRLAVRQWQRQFDHRVEPLARQVEKLRHTVGHDLALAVARLSELIRTVSAYAEHSPPSPSSAASAADADSAGDESPEEDQHSQPENESR